MTITVKLVLATCMTNTVNQHHTHKNDVGAPAAFTHRHFHNKNSFWKNPWNPGTVPFVQCKSAWHKTRHQPGTLGRPCMNGKETWLRCP